MANVSLIPRTLILERTHNKLYLDYIDQTRLPDVLQKERTADWRDVIQAIKKLAIRGAPAIGVAGAAAVALWVSTHASLEGLSAAADEISSARPTAVNLQWGVARALKSIEGYTDREAALETLFTVVKEMENDDECCNRAIGAFGADLIPQNAHILTHCNAGSLATVFYGTALGVVYSAAEQGKIARVYADETRPVGQGARLTAWELAQAGVPVTLICDNMAASLMESGTIDAVVVGADRIAANGDVANKIGTYGLAVLANYHSVPFYVAAPSSTLDLTIPQGSCIPIEQRSADEIVLHAIEGVDVWNPAFDVTPASLVTRIITDKGVFAPEDLVAHYVQ